MVCKFYAKINKIFKASLIKDALFVHLNYLLFSLLSILRPMGTRLYFTVYSYTFAIIKISKFIETILNFIF